VAAWWRSNRRTIFSLWFAGWLFLAQVVLLWFGQREAADFVMEWRGAVIALSAGILHYAFHDEEGPQAVALAILVWTGFWVIQTFGGSSDDCFAGECPTSEAGMGGAAIIGSALVLTYYRPMEAKLKLSVSFVRGYLLTKGAEPATIDKVLDGTLRYDKFLFPNGVEKPWVPPEWMKKLQDESAARGERPSANARRGANEPGGAGTSFVDIDGDGTSG
jgi:hypothetical protein